MSIIIDPKKVSRVEIAGMINQPATMAYLWSVSKSGSLCCGVSFNWIFSFSKCFNCYIHYTNELLVKNQITVRIFRFNHNPPFFLANLHIIRSRNTNKCKSNVCPLLFTKIGCNIGFRVNSWVQSNDSGIEIIYKKRGF